MTELKKSQKKKVVWNFNSADKLLEWNNVHTVCEESACPNRLECSRLKTATFMIGGKYCSRNCHFCKVEHGKPLPLDQFAKKEREEIYHAVEKLALQYAVITSVTRDDDQNGLANHFSIITRELKKRKISVELLIPDFSANEKYLGIIGDSFPDVIAHNLETVRELTPIVRSRATFEKSLKVLQFYRVHYPKILLKTGIMVGLGETTGQLLEFFRDIKKTGIDILTIGQYLRPGAEQAEVKKYYTAEEFDELKYSALAAGIKNVESGFYIRSSYKARTLYGSTIKETND